MKILDHLIRHTIITSTLLVSAIMLGIQSFLSLAQQFMIIGQHHFGVWQALLFVPMQLPAQFYQLFPIAGFLGALIGLSRLSSSSQLIVMRTSGISVMGIAWSVLKAAILMIVIITVIGEGMGPQWQQRSEKMREQALSPSTHPSLLKSVWLHHNTSFFHIGALNNQTAMVDVTRYHFAENGRLKSVTIAQSGRLIHNQWQLSHLKKTIFLPNHIVVTSKLHDYLHIAFVSNLQMQMSLFNSEQNLSDLYHTIRYRQSIGLLTNQYVFTFWQRVLQPLTTLIMICLAVPFVFGSFRNASMGMRILVGVFIGFSFYMLNQLFGPITLVYRFPPLFAAIFPTCLFLFIAIILLVRTK